MPPFIIGILYQETVSHYVLASVVEETEDFEYRTRSELDFISKTYVWRCEFLEEKPDFSSPYAHDDEEGLG